MLHAGSLSPINQHLRQFLRHTSITLLFLISVSPAAAKCFSRIKYEVRKTQSLLQRAGVTFYQTFSGSLFIKESCDKVVNSICYCWTSSRSLFKLPTRCLIPYKKKEGRKKARLLTRGTKKSRLMGLEKRRWVRTTRPKGLKSAWTRVQNLKQNRDHGSL